MGGPEYDLLIAGGGPAGLTAGIYATRGGLRTVLIEKMVSRRPGRQHFLDRELSGFPGRYPRPGTESGHGKPGEAFRPGDHQRGD